MRAILLAALAAAAAAAPSAASHTVCDAACQRHVRLVEGGILFLTLGIALFSGIAFMRAVDVPTRFLGGERTGEAS